MGIIGHEILQTRRYMDPTPDPPPSLNYKLTYPITVYEAVKRSMEDKTNFTLKDDLDEIYRVLRSKQNIIPAKPSNYLVTYGGAAGAIGAVKMTDKISINPKNWSSFLIPTEKAVGEFLLKYGLLNKIPEDGKKPDDGKCGVTSIIDAISAEEIIGLLNGTEQPSPTDPIEIGSSVRKSIIDAITRDEIIRLIDGTEQPTPTNPIEIGGCGNSGGNIIAPNISWLDIVGRPNIYNELGEDQDGLINQKALSKYINEIKLDIKKINDNFDDSELTISKIINDHINNKNNPHGITIEQIKGVSLVDFNNHIENYNNPHKVTKEQVGLSNVDNTSDIDKPISTATQEVLDKIIKDIEKININSGLMNFVTGLNYNKFTGRLDALYSDGSRKGVTIITNSLIDEIVYDHSKTSLIVTELSGETKEVSLKSLSKQYTGADSKNITISIDTDNNISAVINPKSIKGSDISDNTLTSQLFEDKTITGNKIADNTITNESIKNKTISGDKIANHTIDTSNIKPASVDVSRLIGANSENMFLMTREANLNPTWGKFNTSMIAPRSITTELLDNYCITSEKLRNGIIGNGHMTPDSISTNNIKDNSITSEKLVPNLIFKGIPKLDNTIDALSNDNTIVTSSWVRETIKNSETKDITISPRSITGTELFSSNIKNRVLSVTEVNTDPKWTTINSDMLENSIIDETKIKDNSIGKEKLKTGIIDNTHLEPRSVNTINLVDNCITSEKLFSTTEKDMVLAVTGNNTQPQYTKITNSMLSNDSVTGRNIQDKSVTMEKISLEGIGINTVLTLSQDNTNNPIFAKINNGMLLDNIITSDKLFKTTEANMVLAARDVDSSAIYTKINGSMIEQSTIESINIKEKAITGDRLADRTIEARHLKAIGINNQLFPPEIPFMVLGLDNKPKEGSKWVKLVGDMIQNNTIGLEKMIKPTTPNTIIGINALADDLSFIKINNDFIIDNTITSSKLAENLLFRGIPKIETSPSPDSNSNDIPDTKWVRNLVSSIQGGGSPTPPPQYNGDKVTTEMITDSAVTSNKIANQSITTSHLINEPIIQEKHIFDNSVTENKISNNSITNDKIKINSISGDRLKNNTVLPDTISVKEKIDIVYEKSVLRNTIISNSAPKRISDTDLGNGNIWIQFE